MSLLVVARSSTLKSWCREALLKSYPVVLHLVAVVKMDVFADSKIQLGPLIDFNTEELERANADTWRMSTPKEKNEVREPDKEDDILSSSISLR